MFGKKKKPEVTEYDRENWKPVLRCSICNGEQVAGLQNVHTGEFREVGFIRSAAELKEFKLRYGVVGEITKVY